MEELLVYYYCKSDRFQRFIKKLKLDISFEENKLTAYVREDIPENKNKEYLNAFVEYSFSSRTETFKHVATYELEGLDDLPEEIQYPDEVRAVLRKISESIK